MTSPKMSIESVSRVGPESVAQPRMSKSLGGSFELRPGPSTEGLCDDTFVKKPLPPSAGAAQTSPATPALGCAGSIQVGDRPGSCRDKSQQRRPTTCDEAQKGNADVPLGQGAVQVEDHYGAGHH